MAFDLEALKNNLLAAIEGEKGHDMSAALVIAQLIKHQEVKDLFADKGVDIERMEGMLQLEIRQKHKKKLRDIEMDSDTHEEGGFEAQKAQQRRSHYQSEKAHELIDGIELAFLNQDITPTDVLRETLRNAPVLFVDHENPVKIFVQALSGQNVQESAGVETFKALEFNPMDLFPELKSKKDGKTQQALDEAAQKTGKFLVNVLAEIQKTPAASNAIEDILKTGPKSQGRTPD